MLAPIGRKRLEIELQLALAAAGSGCKPLKPQSGFEMSPHLGTAQIHNKGAAVPGTESKSCARYRPTVVTGTAAPNVSTPP